MLKTSGPIYAGNNKQIAKALGLKTNRKMLAQIGEWRARPDFPKKAKGSWFRVEELRQWHAEFLKQPPLLSPAEASAQYEKAFLSLFLRGKKPVELCKPSERKILQKHGLLPPDHPSDDDHPPASELGFSSNQTGLTEAMARRFGQKFGFIISENKVSEFLRGKGIPAGAKSPPTKIKGRFNNSEWAQWLDATFGRNGHDPQGELLTNDYRRLANAELAKEEYAAGLAKIKFETADKRYVRADQARNTRRGMLKLALIKVQRGLENQDPKARADWLAAHLNPAPEMLRAFRELDGQLARARLDAIFDDFQKHIAADPETPQSQELAEETQ